MFAGTSLRDFIFKLYWASTNWQLSFPLDTDVTTLLRYFDNRRSAIWFLSPLYKSIYRNLCQAVKIQSIRLQVPLYNQARYQWITSSHGSFTAKSIAWVQKNWLKKTFDVSAPRGALGVTSMCHGRAPWVRHSKVIKKKAPLSWTSGDALTSLQEALRSAQKSIFSLIFLIADFAEKEGLLVVYDINSAKIYNNKQ